MKKLVCGMFFLLSLLCFNTQAQNSYSISAVTTEDATGVADSLGVVCYLHGIIVGVDLQAGNGQVFTMIDSTTGIVFYSATDLIPGYLVTNGDSIHVRGTISQARGLTFISADSLSIVSSGNTLRSPKVVNEPTELTEGDYIRINNLQIIGDPWPRMSGQFGRVFAHNGVDTVEIIIDPETDIDGSLPPVGLFDVVGTGSQRDDTSPYTEDYLIFPQFGTDIIRKGFFPGVLQVEMINLISEDSLGVADSLGLYCQTTGKISSVDYADGSGFNFVVEDRGRYLNVRSNSDVSSGGYQPTIGNNAAIRGEMKQLNGMLYMEIDSLVSTDSLTISRYFRTVTELKEIDEANYVQLAAYHLVDTMSWPISSASGTVLVENMAGDQYKAFISSATNIDGSPIPYGYFNIDGYVFQNDSTSPFTDNYEIWPQRRISFNELLTSVYFSRSSDKLSEQNSTMEVKLILDFPQHVDLDIAVLVTEGVGIDTNDICYSPAPINDTIYLTIPANLDTVTFDMILKDDTLAELKEIVDFEIVSINGTSTAISGSKDYRVSLQDNDSRNISFETDQLTVLETVGSVDIKILSSSPAPAMDTLKILLTELNGISSADYSTSPAAIMDTITLNMNLGDTSATFTINVNDDNLAELKESLKFEIVSFSQGIVLGNNETIDFNIEDNEPRDLDFITSFVTLPEDTGMLNVNLALNTPAFVSGSAAVLVQTGLGVTATDFTTNPIASGDTLYFNFNVGDTSATFELNILNDTDPESSEQISFKIIALDSNFRAGADSLGTYTILDDDVLFIPTYNINTVRGTDMNGAADSLGVQCKLQGIVLGIDILGASNTPTQFTIVDNSGGISVANMSGFTPAYVVQEGDEVLVTGSIGQVNGLITMLADSLTMLSSGNSIPLPFLVTQLMETTESRLIQMNRVSLVTPSNWPSSGADASLLINDGTNSHTMLIDKDSDVDGTAAPKEIFSVVGIGSQDDATSPYDADYLFSPRFRTDIISANHLLVAPNNMSSISLIGTGSTAIDFTGSTPINSISATTNYTFLLDTLNGDFSNPVISSPCNNGGADTSLTLTYGAIDMLLDGLGVGISQPFTMKWTIRANSSLFEANADEYEITFSRDGVGFEALKLNEYFNLYPNPTTGQVVIKSIIGNNEILDYELISTQGQVVQSGRLGADGRISINTESSGIYFISLSSDKMKYIGKLVLIK